MAVKILIVDDEKFIIEEMSEILTEEGYECFTATNGSDALAILKRDPAIFVLLTDMKMPKESGLELIRKAHAEVKQEMAFIVMSGHGAQQLVNESRDDLKYWFLHKPIDFTELLDTLDKSVVATQHGR